MKKLLFSLFAVVFLLLGCVPSRPARDCAITDFLLKEMDFPTGTIVNQVGIPVSEYPMESAGFTASLSGDSIYQVVAQYPSYNRARKKFDKSYKSMFDVDNRRGPWEKPLDVAFMPSVAQQYYVACGNVASKYQCRMIGQYEEYYVFFSSYISERGITLEVYDELLQKIDGIAGRCLE